MLFKQESILDVKVGNLLQKHPSFEVTASFHFSIYSWLKLYNISYTIGKQFKEMIFVIGTFCTA